MAAIKKRKPLIIGLTGVPGTGKSAVADYFRDKGAMILSGDKIGHEILDYNHSAKRQLVKIFSRDILNNEGQVDRKKLGLIVFSDADSLRKLNEIVHPPLLRMLKARIKKAKSERKSRLIIVDAALIFEWGIVNWFDFILVVTSPRYLSIRRMMSKGLTHRQACQKMSSQWKQSQKKELADYVISNKGSLRQLTKEAERIHKLLSRYESDF